MSPNDQLRGGAMTQRQQRAGRPPASVNYMRIRARPGLLCPARPAVAPPTREQQADRRKHADVNEPCGTRGRATEISVCVRAHGAWWSDGI